MSKTTFITLYNTNLELPMQLDEIILNINKPSTFQFRGHKSKDFIIDIINKFKLKYPKLPKIARISVRIYEQKYLSNFAKCIENYKIKPEELSK